MENNNPRSRSAATLEWMLALIIIGLLVFIGWLLANPGPSVGATIIGTSTATPEPATETIAPRTSTPSLTPSATTTPSATPTPSLTPSITPTPRPPLPGVADTITPLPTPEVITTTVTPIPTPAPLVDLPLDSINIVILGSDRRPGDNSWRTDTIILASVHQNPAYVTLLTIPRDLWVYIPNIGFNRINVADSIGQGRGFPGGGAGLLKQTIQYNLGVEVQYYLRIDFDAFRKIIDTLGTVRAGDDRPTLQVLAECALTDVFPDVPDGQSDIIASDQLSTTITGTLEIVPGYNALDSKHALWYARSRMSTNDFDRSRRILNLGTALLQAAHDNGSFGKVPELWNELSASVQTDLTLNDVVWLAGIASELDRHAIKLRQIDNVATANYLADSGAQVLTWNPEVLALVLAEAFEAPPENLAAQAAARVEVYNASGLVDWDDLAVSRLLRSNFDVVLPDNPVTEFRPDSILVDFTTTPKGSRVAQLARLFNIPPAGIIAQPDPSSPVAYRLFVGAGFDPCRKPPPPVEVTPTPSPTPDPNATPTPAP